MTSISGSVPDFLTKYWTSVFNFKHTVAYRCFKYASKNDDIVLTKEEIIECKHKVPTQQSQPWQVVHFVNIVTDRGDLLKASHLNSQHLKTKTAKHIVYI